MANGAIAFCGCLHCSALGNPKPAICIQVGAFGNPTGTNDACLNWRLENRAEALPPRLGTSVVWLPSAVPQNSFYWINRFVHLNLPFLRPYNRAIMASWCDFRGFSGWCRAAYSSGPFHVPLRSRGTKHTMHRADSAPNDWSLQLHLIISAGMRNAVLEPNRLLIRRQRWHLDACRIPSEQARLAASFMLRSLPSWFAGGRGRT